MLRVNMQRTGYVGWFAAGAALLLLGTLATASAQAGVISADGTVFTDDFTTLDTATVWSTYTANGATITASGGFVTLAQPSGSEERLYNQSGQVTLGTSTNWAAETRFKMTDTLSSADNRQWIVLQGVDTATWNADGFDLRALTVDSTHFQLGWGGFNGHDWSQASVPIGSALNMDQFYTVVAHRKPDGNVDIYVDDTLIDTQPVFGTTNPLELNMGLASSGGYGTMVTDYVKVGAFVPEPSTFVLLATGLFGLLAYAWRKRRS